MIRADLPVEFWYSDREDARLFRGGVMDAETVVLVGLEGLMKGRRVVVPGFRNKALAIASRLAPRRFVTRIVRKLNEDCKRT